jgi:hypothetical protein
MALHFVSLNFKSICNIIFPYLSSFSRPSFLFRFFYQNILFTSLTLVLNAFQVIQKKVVLEEHIGRGHTGGLQIDRALLEWVSEKWKEKWTQSYHVELQLKLKLVLDVHTRASLIMVLALNQTSISPVKRLRYRFEVLSCWGLPKHLTGSLSMCIIEYRFGCACVLCINYILNYRHTLRLQLCIRNDNVITQCVRKVSVHLGYGT